MELQLCIGVETLIKLSVPLTFVGHVYVCTLLVGYMYVYIKILFVGYMYV